MFTHEQTLEAINEALGALGEPQLDGIPVAAPAHVDMCVLGCSFRKYGAVLSDYQWDDDDQPALIEFDLPATRDLVLEAWQRVGVECNARKDDNYAIEFTGGLAGWMRKFDKGGWEQLVVPDYDRENQQWPPAGQQPGDVTVSVDELPPVVA